MGSGLIPHNMPIIEHSVTRMGMTGRISSRNWESDRDSRQASRRTGLGKSSKRWSSSHYFII